MTTGNPAFRIPEGKTELRLEHRSHVYVQKSQRTNDAAPREHHYARRCKLVVDRQLERNLDPPRIRALPPVRSRRLGLRQCASAPPLELASDPLEIDLTGDDDAREQRARGRRGRGRRESTRARRKTSAACVRARDRIARPGSPDLAHPERVRMTRTSGNERRMRINPSSSKGDPLYGGKPARPRPQGAGTRANGISAGFPDREPRLRRHPMGIDDVLLRRSLIEVHVPLRCFVEGD